MNRGSCIGECCTQCGADAARKIEEVLFDDAILRHPHTAYLCQPCFDALMKRIDGPSVVELQRLVVLLADWSGYENSGCASTEVRAQIKSVRGVNR